MKIFENARYVKESKKDELLKSIGGFSDWVGRAFDIIGDNASGTVSLHQFVGLLFYLPASSMVHLYSRFSVGPLI